MKKSELETKIRHVIEAEQQNGTSYSQASAVMKLLEVEGMQPPVYEGLQASGKKFVRETDQGRDVMWCKGWEPED